MRILMLALLLAATAFAGDNAADLFYKAFWEEQAGGKAANARSLYLRVLKKHPESPEASRALLGVIRIDASQGKDVRLLVARMEKEYPEARDDLAQARRVAAAYTKEFDPDVTSDDPPTIRKVKDLYRMCNLASFGQVPVDEDDENFLIDLGAAAHPMLRELLRAPRPSAVRFAAGLLLRQRSPAALRIVAEALNDDLVPLRGVIVQSVRGQPEGSKQLVEPLLRLYGRSGARLRGEVLGCLRAAGYFAPAADYARICAVFTQALDDPDERVRREAASPPVSLGAYDSVPDDYVRALLKRLEGGDPAPRGTTYAMLPHFAQREGMGARIESILEKQQPLNPQQVGQPKHEEGALLLARLARKQWQRYNTQELVRSLVKWSPECATELLLSAIENDEQPLARVVTQTAGKDLAAHLGHENAERVRVAALSAASPVGPANKFTAADTAVYALGLEAGHFPAVLRALKTRTDLPAAVLTHEFIRAIGPEKAAQLAPFCKTEQQVQFMLGAGVPFLKGGPELAARSIVLFKALVPRAGPRDAAALRTAAAYSPAVAALVAERLLGARGEEWKWHQVVFSEAGAPQGMNTPQSASYVWSTLGMACTKEPLRTRLLSYVQDDRVLVATQAVAAAGQLETEAGTNALVRALDSTHKYVRHQALQAVATRGERGIDEIGKFLAREKLGSSDRYYALKALGAAGDERAAPIVATLLSRRDKDASYGWSLYLKLAPRAALELALNESLAAEAGDEFRAAALRVLSQNDDKRRIDVFRRILLEEKNPELLQVVLQTVSSQYLIELGEEVLLHLRNPDARAREAATSAIKQLKFYAEARESFRKSK